jgi:uncharacterized protein YlxP (DUF503 family)
VIVGLMVIEFISNSSHSLKDKRHVISSIKERLRNKFNISIIESDFQDLWQKVQLSIALVSNSKVMAEKIFDRIEDFIFDNYSLQLINVNKDYF